LINRNPLAGIEPIGTRGQRARNLTDTEIALFWRACEQIGWPFGPLFQLLLMLGCRRSELARATWLEFDLQARTWELPGTRTKNGNPHLTHLPRLALDIIGGLPHVSNPADYVFCTGRRATAKPVSGFSDAAQRVHKMMNGASGIEIAPFTRHDLRRTFSTGMAKLQVRQEVTDKLLNHSGGVLSGVRGVYNKFQYLDERRQALEVWARHVEGLIGVNRQNVTELHA
jgi:integrase